MGFFDGIVGLLDDPRQVGQLNMALGLLDAGGPSTTPTSFGQALARAGAAGVKGYQGALQQQRENQMQDLKMKQIRGLLDSQEAEQQDRQTERDFWSKAPSFMQNGALDAKALYSGMLSSGVPKLAQTGIQGLSAGEEAFTLSPGQKRFKGNQVLAEVEPENKKLELERMLDAANITDPMERAKWMVQALTKQTTHSPAVNVSYGAPVAGVDASGNQVFFQPSKDGSAPAIIPGVRPPGETGKPPTEFEAKAGLYFKSMQQASQTLGDIEKNGNPLPQPQELIFPGQTAKNVVRSPERQSYVQAQRQWIDSINRVRSGANLPEIEYDRAVMTFFPQFGDSSATIKQKASARKQEEEAMSTAAGRALKPGDFSRSAEVENKPTLPDPRNGPPPVLKGKAKFLGFE